MLSEYEVLRLRNTAEVEKQSGELFTEYHNLLRERARHQRKRLKPFLVALAEHSSSLSRDRLSSDEVADQWIYKERIDLGERTLSSITVRGVGGRAFSGMRRIFVDVEEAHSFLELSPMGPHIWEKQDDGKKIKHYKSGRANLDELSFYRTVIDKLKEISPPPSVSSTAGAGG